MVVLFHAAGTEQNWKAPISVFKPFSYFGFGGVELFFAISGFLMVYISQGKFGLTGAVREFLWRRTLRIYPVYWLVWMGTVAIFMGWFDVTQCSEPVALIRAFALAVHENCFIPQAWSLHYELAFYLLFSTLLFFPPRVAFWVGVAGAFLLFAFKVEAVAQLAPALARYVSAFLYFLPGCAVALITLKLKTRYGRLAILLGVLWLAASGIANAFNWMDMESGEHRLIQFSVASALLIYGTVSWEWSGNGWKLPRWVVAIGNASYVIYLIHLTAFPLLARATLLMGLSSETAVLHVLRISTLVLVTIALGLVTHKLIERPLLMFLNLRRPMRRWSGPQNAQARCSPLR